MRPGKPQRLPRLLRTLACVVLAALAVPGRSQYVDWGEPQQPTQWTDFAPRMRYVQSDLEMERDHYTTSGSPSQTVDHLYWTTGLGMTWNNYVYHPYLMTYSALFEPAYALQESGPSGQMSQSDMWLVDGNVTANLLGSKPYATSVFYSRSHSQQHDNFFNTATVDTDGWGVNSGYLEGPVPVTVSFTQTHSDSTSLYQDATTDQTLFNLHAWNERGKEDRTDLTYQYGEFNQGTTINQQTTPSGGTTGTTYNNQNNYNHVALTDIEYFTKSTLRSFALYNDTGGQNSSSSSQFNGSLNLNVVNTPQLQTYYDYALSHNSTSQSDSTQNSGTAGLTHQLYESLTSGLSVNGSTEQSSSSGSTSDYNQVGIGASENYVKRLGDWGSLNLSDNASYTFNDQQTTGEQQEIVNESHVVPPSRVVILNQPNDIAIGSVTDSTGTKQLIPGADYTVNESVNPWQIVISVINSANIQPGNGILVTYTAASNPSGNYEVFANQARVTLTFWHNHADVFASYNFTDNRSSSTNFLFDNEQQLQVGADFNWLRFSVHGDYTDNHTSYYDSQQYNLSESYALAEFARTSVSFNMNQIWGTYHYNTSTNNQTQSATFYTFMLHCNTRLQANCTWNTEVGYQDQHGLNVDQQLFAARTFLNWSRGKLAVHAGYEHEMQDFNTQSSLQNYVFVRVRRDF